MQATWATKWGDFEKRLRRQVLRSFTYPSILIGFRVESFLEMCAPITIAQHALTRSKTLAMKSEDTIEPDIFHKV